jgi:DNA-binding winged helix-turn-helix (wHTH) protein/Tol biopolymer transport system component
MMGNKPFVYRFGEFEVREHEFSLTKAGVALPVEPKAFRALLFLLRNPQKLIPKEQLVHAIWGETAVADGSLTRCIWLLRRLLSDDFNDPRYIATVATVGYRFICPVEVSEESQPQAQPFPDPPPGPPGTDRVFAMNPKSTPDTKLTDERKLTRSKLIWWTGSGIALTVLILSGWPFLQSSLSRRAQNLAPMKVRTLTESGKAAMGAITADGRYVGYVKRDAAMEELRILQTSTGRDIQLTPGSPLKIWNLHFSPDGNFLYFLRQLKPDDLDSAGVFRIAALGGMAKSLASDAVGNMHGITVSPDGNQVAYVTHSSTQSVIVSIDPDGVNRHILANCLIGYSCKWIEWSHSLNTLAVIVTGPRGDAITHGDSLMSVDLPSGTWKDLIFSGFSTIGQPAWSPDDKEIYAPAEASGTINQIWAIDARTGAKRPLTSNSSHYSVWSLSTTSAGDLLAVVFASALTLWTTDQSTQINEIPSLRSEGREKNSVIWVENRIVSTVEKEMVVHAPDDHSSTNFETGSEYYLLPAQCGKGQIAYGAYNDKFHWHIARTDVKTGATIAIAENAASFRGAACTADGSTLVYTAETPDKGYLMRRSLNAGELLIGPSDGSEVLHEFDQSSPLWPTISPDGKAVLFRLSSNSGIPTDWEIMPIRGGASKKLILPVAMDAVTAFKWAPDGTSILYAKNENGVGNIWSIPLKGGHPKMMTNFRSEQIFSFDVSSDNRLVVARGHDDLDLVLLENMK